MNFYNEHDPKAAAWLRELINQGLIPAGIVDTRSITEIQAHELTQYTQCHFFAGIGGWSLALELAEWPATRPVWTGSCPCQPFSTAGKQLAQADERHLWPVFFNLIRECRPESVFGEQVASAIGKGWLDGVSADLEAAGYACGAAVLGAHSVGSPHIRQRLYWVADAGHERAGRTPAPGQAEGGRALGHVAGCGERSRMADATGERSGPRRAECEGQQRTAAHGGVGSGVADAGSKGCEGRERNGQTGTQGASVGHAGECGGDCGVGNAISQRLGGRDERGLGEGGEQVAQQEDRADATNQSGNGREDAGAWSDFILIPCADGKARRIEPSLAPLAHGIPARVVRLRGYGNAIVPQVAAEFVKAFGESRE